MPVAATGALSVAKRSYPTSEVRGRSREDSMPEGRQPRGVTPHPRSGAAAESARLQWCRKVREELPRIRGQEQRLGGATPRLRPGAVAGRSNPTSKERWLRGCRRASRSYPTLKVRKGGGKETALIQGKEQWLCFVGAAVKRGKFDIPGWGRAPGVGSSNPLQYLAQKIPWTEEPGGLQSMWSQSQT